MAAFESKAVASGTDDAIVLSASRFLRLIGFSIGESGTPAATASVKFYNGQAATGEVVIPICNLAATGFGTFWYGPDGIPCPDGLFLERVSGETEVVVYYGNV